MVHALRWPGGRLCCSYQFRREARHRHSETTEGILEQPRLEGEAQLGGLNQIHAAATTEGEESMHIGGNPASLWQQAPLSTMTVLSSNASQNDVHVHLPG